MIVPRDRLLWTVAVVALPLAVLAALWPVLGGVAMALAAGVFLMAALDAVLGIGVLAGIEVGPAPPVRLTRGRAGEVSLPFRNSSGRSRELRFGLAFPARLSSPAEETTAVLPAGQDAWRRLAWTCLPLERGRYRLDRCYLEGATPLGFWAVRRAVPIDLELRVYPDLARQRRHLAALFLHRGGHGLHPHRQLGQGREFEKLREYIPGDTWNEIHWKATAKRGRPITKVFQLERTQEVYVVVDASRLSRRPSGRTELDPAAGALGEPAVLHDTILERYLQAALILGLVAHRQGDLFGLLTFTDRVEGFVRAGGGREHLNRCRNILYDLQPQAVSPDFDELAAFIRVRLRRRALLVFLTHLDDPVLGEAFLRSMRMLRSHHLVVACMMRPPDARTLFADGGVRSVDDVYQRLGGHLVWHGLTELERVFRREGLLFSLLEHEGLCQQLVSRYVQIKQRQLL